MSTGYGWEGIRQVCAMLLDARHVPEHLSADSVYLGRCDECSTFTFTTATLALSEAFSFTAYSFITPSVL